MLKDNFLDELLEIKQQLILEIESIKFRLNRCYWKHDNPRYRYYKMIEIREEQLKLLDNLSTLFTAHFFKGNLVNKTFIETIFN